MKYFFYPAYSFGLLISISATLPGSELQKIQQLPDNVLIRFLLSDPFMHFLTFGILSFLICYGYRRSAYNVKHRGHSANKSKKANERGKSLKTNIPYFNAGLIAVGYSFLIEIYQWILPWRSFEIGDLAWNITGVILSNSGLYLAYEIF